MTIISTATATEVTEEQIARCHRCTDENNGGLPFYIVESEKDDGQEYKVATIRKNGKWYVTCTCPAGLKGVPCKHKRWVKAAAAEYKELLKAEAQAQARIDAEKARKSAYQAERERLYAELRIEYASVDNETLKRIAERNKKPARITYRKGYQANPFRLV